MPHPVEATIRKAIGSGLVTASKISRQLKNPFRRHPFLSGVHTPLQDEFSLTDLRVEGEIPPALDGRYIRIGPNPFRPDPRGHHWFLGDGMVHGVRLRGGRAEWYHNRYIRSRMLEAAGGPTAVPGPRRGPRDMVNTNVLQLAGRTLALVEAGTPPVELDESLDSVAYTNFNGRLTAPFSAHPHEDPLTGEWHAITYDPQQQETIWHVAINRDGEVLRQLAIPVRDGPSIHECALTERFVVVFDLPVTLSLPAMAGGFQFPYRWNPDHRARVGLLPRTGCVDDIIWCDVDPCYVFHVANSFERDEQTVIIDCAVYETMFDHGPDGPNGKPLGFERWEVDLQARVVKRTTLDASAQEFPRIDERRFGQSYRYAWSVETPAETVSDFCLPNALYGFDMDTGARSEHRFGDNLIGGEFVFVPRSADAAEGDGWLMGYVINAVEAVSELRIIDAGDIAAAPLARIYIPHRIPPGFHGNWVPAA